MIRATCEICERPIAMQRPLRQRERQELTGSLATRLDGEMAPDAPLVAAVCPPCYLAAWPRSPWGAPSLLLPLRAPWPPVAPLVQALAWFFQAHPDAEPAPVPLTLLCDDGVVKIPSPGYAVQFAWLRAQLLVAEPPEDLWVIVQALAETYALRRSNAWRDKEYHDGRDE